MLGWGLHERRDHNVREHEAKFVDRERQMQPTVAEVAAQRHRNLSDWGCAASPACLPVVCRGSHRRTIHFPLCFSLQLMHERVHGIAFNRAAETGSPQSRHTP